MRYHLKGFVALGATVVVFFLVFHRKMIFGESPLVQRLVAVLPSVLPQDGKTVAANSYRDKPAKMEPENVSLTESTSLEQATTGPPVEVTNPGCVRRVLSEYKPKRSARVYHHPPLVHYAKFTYGTGTLSYMEYMAMLSAYKFLKPKRILVHSNTDIKGHYWDLAQRWEGTSVEVNRVPRVRQLGGKHVHWVQHEADYIKLKQMLEHGGVTSDFDVLVVNGTKLREQQRVSECVLSQEGDIVSNGFNSCIKNSSFIRRILERYQSDYRPHLWLYNCALYPTDILQEKKGSCYNMYLDDTICIYPNVAQAPQWWLSRNGVNWRKKTAAHYFVKTGYPSNEKLLDADHSLAELFRYVNDS